MTRCLFIWLKETNENEDLSPELKALVARRFRGTMPIVGLFAGMYAVGVNEETKGHLAIAGEPLTPRVVPWQQLDEYRPGPMGGEPPIRVSKGTHIEVLVSGAVQAVAVRLWDEVAV